MDILYLLGDNDIYVRLVAEYFLTLPFGMNSINFFMFITLLIVSRDVQLNYIVVYNEMGRCVYACVCLWEGGGGGVLAVI